MRKNEKDKPNIKEQQDANESEDEVPQRNSI